MADQTTPPIRVIKTLAERAAELEVQEKALAAQIQAKQRDLQDLVIQRCAIAYEQRRGIGPSLQKKQAVAADWAEILKLEDSERRAVKKARAKALADLHLKRAWVSWGKHSQIIVAFELSKENVGEMFWVRDGIEEILPHLQPALPGYKCIGICHSGPFSVRYFLLCAESGNHFRIVETYLRPGDDVLFECNTLHEALEFAQKNFAR
jgi:hypothetical protein